MSGVLVSSRGQVLIPAEMRRRLNITPGDLVNVEAVGNKIEISLQRSRIATSTHVGGFGMLRYAGSPRKLADFDVVRVMKSVRRRAPE